MTSTGKKLEMKRSSSSSRTSKICTDADVLKLLRRLADIVQLIEWWRHGEFDGFTGFKKSAWIGNSLRRLKNLRLVKNAKGRGRGAGGTWFLTNAGNDAVDGMVAISGGEIGKRSKSKKKL